MTRFIARRLLQMVPVLFFVSLIIFVLINLVPGDAARLFLGEESSPDALRALRHEMGLDRPLYIQYVRWIGNMFHGDFGHSFKDNRQVLATVVQKVPVTAELTAAALLIAWAINRAAAVSSAVTGTFCTTVARTWRLSLNEWPKSPRNMFPIQRRY